MSDPWGVEAQGLIEIRNELNRIARELHGGPMVDAMQDATLYVTHDARGGAPVDTGALRASIIPNVVSVDNVVQGVVGSNKEYAPTMEFGTDPYWPRVSDLETWARRHGMSAFAVARAISRRGIEGRRYLRDALRKNVDRIARRLERAVQIILGD